MWTRIFSTRLTLAGLIAVALIASCRQPTANINAEPTRQVTDDRGRTIIVPVNITRIVSTAPSVTENIFAVGVGDRVVGVTTFCNYPDAARSIQKIGDTMTPNMETILALKPDIVLVSTDSQIENFTKTLEANGIAVYVMDPSSLEEMIESLVRLGHLFGTQEQTGQLVGEIDKRQEALSRIVSRQPMSVFVQISNEPLFTIGKRSFLTAALPKAGARSVTANIESAYPKLSKETAAALNPEAIILSQSEDNREPNEVFKNSPAIKNRRIYKVNADILSRPGPRLVDALEQIARHLHPDKFGQAEK